MTNIDVPDGHLHVERHGAPDRTTVILLHGGGLDSRMWDDQLTALSRHHHVVAVDARGHGASTTPTAPFRHADDVAAVIEGLNCGPAVLIGLSMGAQTATETALEYPGLVRALILSGAGTHRPEFTDPWILRIQDRLDAAAKATDAQTWIETFCEFASGPERTLNDVEPSVVERLRAMVADTIGTHYRPDSVGPTFVTGPVDRLTELNLPVLAVCGAADSPDHIRMAREVVDATGGDTVLIAGTGHYPNMERPSEFNTACLDFLTGVEHHGR